MTDRKHETVFTPEIINAYKLEKFIMAEDILKGNYPSYLVNLHSKALNESKIKSEIEIVRKKLIELYCSTYGCRDIMSLASKMDHPAFTHDYVKDICEHSLIFDDKELEEFLDKTISYLKEQTKNTY